MQAESWKFGEPYLGSEVAEGMRNRLLKIPNFITLLFTIDRGPNKESKNEQTWLKYAEIQEQSDLVCKLQLQ